MSYIETTRTRRKPCISTEETNVHFTDESYSRLEAIPLHPTYRDYVKKLYIIPKAIRGPLLQRDDFEKLLRSDKMMVENEIACKTHTNDLQRLVVLPNSVKLTPSIINFRYGRYSSLHSPQESLLLTVEGHSAGRDWPLCAPHSSGVRADMA